jgi:hypothetical protein
VSPTFEKIVFMEKGRDQPWERPPRRERKLESAQARPQGINRMQERLLHGVKWI